MLFSEITSVSIPNQVVELLSQLARLKYLLMHATRKPTWLGLMRRVAAVLLSDRPADISCSFWSVKAVPKANWSNEPKAAKSSRICETAKHKKSWTQLNWEEVNPSAPSFFFVWNCWKAFGEQASTTELRVSYVTSQAWASLKHRQASPFECKSLELSSESEWIEEWAYISFARGCWVAWLILAPLLRILWSIWQFLCVRLWMNRWVA